MAAMKKVRSIILAVALAWVGACKHCSAGDAQVDVLIAQGIEAAEKKQPDTAIKLFRQAIRKDPRASNAYMDLAVIYARDKKDPKTAEPFIKRAITLDPESYDYRWQHAMILQAQRRFAAAKQVLIESKSLKHDDSDEQQRRSAIAKFDSLAHKVSR
jgi:Flp pilus assembly protein TadD